MLGVFVTALFTRRGNVVSVVCALVAGAITIALLQPGVLPVWTGKLFGHPHKLAWTWWMPIGTVVSFLVCVAGGPRRAREEISDQCGRGLQVVRQ
jgi:hypothetical protein